ncbi:DUF305 domain-containing protein [Nocardia alba]|uniref:DUF305 domain-containing protein n=1 Tax=Nocardia alba TaxID=225051 RepID=UPI000AFD69BE|nr:DUF305 domain-containing protein [Nocardia alba]
MHPTGTHEHRQPSADITVRATSMPGMATQQELDILSAARGQDADLVFLGLMQRHHFGGIQMARAADQLLEGGVVEQTAREMMSSQGQEAGIMGLQISAIHSRSE